jgi:hypothetical protein
MPLKVKYVLLAQLFIDEFLHFFKFKLWEENNSASLYTVIYHNIKWQDVPEKSFFFTFDMIYKIYFLFEVFVEIAFRFSFLVNSVSFD